VWLEAKVNGDASETALMKFFQPIQDILETRKHFQFAKSVDGQPAKMLFNSTFKFALSIVEQRTQNSLYTVFVKGAPEKLWTLCTFIQNGNKAE
jgi:sodium/potassium-transporting ATPase subunit alpha